jgi:murein DD-endopeptidase MepM/ murein hydrolase activator NlpD
MISHKFKRLLKRLGQVVFKIKTIFMEFFRFLAFFIKYLFGKVSSLPRLIIGSYFLFLNMISALKFFLIAKLIWGRGRLFRFVTHVGIISLAIVIIVSGGLLSGTPLVRRAEGFTPTDYLTYSDALRSNPSPATDIPDRPRNEPLDYVVASGDTLSSIGEMFRVSTDAIVYANNIADEDVLRLGQTLIIPPVEGVIYQVKKGDSLASIAAKFKVPEQSIGEFNYIFDNSELKVGQKIVVPEAQIPQVPPAFVPPPVASSRSPRLSPVPLTAYKEGGHAGGVEGSTGSFGWPMNSRSISQYFSRYHLGLDITAPVGTPVYASDGGIVLRSGWWLGGFGNAVKLDHGNGYTTAYAHMSQILVSVGQKVRKGQVVGEVGSTGRSTGPHTHFVVQKDGKYLNPLGVF